MFSMVPSQWIERPASFNQLCCRTIFPERLRVHLNLDEGRKRPHVAVPIGTCIFFRTIHDMPVPIIFEASAHRCLRCHSVSQASSDYVTDDEVRAAFPDVPIGRTPRNGTMLLTRRFLLYLTRTFFDLLSSCVCRRNLVFHYSNTASAMRGPHADLYCISEVPQNHFLRAVPIRGLGAHLREKVCLVHSMVNVYSGPVIRGHIHWSLTIRRGEDVWKGQGTESLCVSKSRSANLYWRVETWNWVLFFFFLENLSFLVAWRDPVLSRKTGYGSRPDIRPRPGPVCQHHN